MRVNWTKPFAANLESARVYVAAEDSISAVVVIKRVMETLHILSRLSDAGRPHFHRPDARSIPVPDSPFVLVYDVNDDGINLLALYHQAMKWPGS